MTRARAEQALRTAVLAALAALLAAAIAGCGQRGPLVLPGAQPVVQPEPPASDTTEPQDDERENER